VVESKTPGKAPAGSQVRPGTAGGKTPAPAVKEAQTPVVSGVTTGVAQASEAASKYKKVEELKACLQEPNTKYTYAVIKGRNNVIITLFNNGRRLKVNIVTATRDRFVSGFDLRQIKKVIHALNDLYNDVTAVSPDLAKPEEPARKSNVRVY
jgi:hypothetical protein